MPLEHTLYHISIAINTSLEQFDGINTCPNNLGMTSSLPNINGQ